MEKTQLKKYLEAADDVCIYCIEPGPDNPDPCANCPVRKSVDYYEREEQYGR